MRALFLIVTFLILRIVDTFTTWQLTSSGRAVELNPTVNTESLLSILLSPVPLLIACIFLGCVIYTEKNAQNFERIVGSGVFPSYPFFFPFYYLLLLGIVCISNTLGIFGIGTPISIIATPFKYITSSTNLQFILGYNFLILLTLPAAIPIVRKMYTSRWNTVSSEDKGTS